MSDGFEEQPWVKLGVSGALQSEYSKDQGFFLELLGKTMKAILPDETELKSKGFIKKILFGVVVSLDDARYSFEKNEHGPVRAVKTKVVRGIALKSEELDVREALEELGDAVEKRAAKSGDARSALANMLGLE